MFPRIHPFTLDNLSSRGKENSRHEPRNFSSSTSRVLVRLPLFGLTSDVSSDYLHAEGAACASSLPLPILRSLGDGQVVQPVLLLAFFFTYSDQPMSYVRFCTHPPSTTSIHVALRCSSVHALVGLSSQHSLDWLQPHSFFQLLTLVCCCPSLPIDHYGLLQKDVFTSRGQPTLISSDNMVCHSGHLVSRSRVSHMTAPAGPLTCLHVCTSKICFLHAFCCACHNLLEQQRRGLFLACCCFHLPP